MPDKIKMTNIAILNLGSELVSGKTANTNAAFISKKLQHLGYEVQKHVVFSDENIKQALKQTLTTADLVIITGGLGPTIDDKTKEEASRFLHLPLTIDQKWLKELKKRKLKTPFLENQALVFQGSKVLANFLGTAPGLIVQQKCKFLIFLPGVPQEMKALFQKHVPAFLKKHFPQKEKIYTEEIFLCSLKEVDVAGFLEKLLASGNKLADFKQIKPGKFKKEQKNKIEKKTFQISCQSSKISDIQIGIYPHYAVLKITLTTKTKAAASKKAKAKILKLKQKIMKEFAPYAFELSESKNVSDRITSSADAALTAALKNLMVKKKKTLAVAESCTGGSISSLLTKEPGASKYFLGGIVSYHNDLKQHLLGVKKETLTNYGAVSPQTVKEMVKGLFKTTKADFAIAVSGIAGPGGGTKKKPVGTVFIALSQRDKKTQTIKLNLVKDRNEIINFSTSFALSRLLVKIKSL